ncbi:MAG TPA: ABC transporter ATP-binding protein [Oceanobacillus sp.]|nr:ABC transporter ATP-binding protein [Oceanobacillus sp.]
MPPTLEHDVRLKLVHVSKQFQDRGGSGQVLAVDDFTLDIHSGEFVTLLGPSGCGKTTTLRMIAGFETPTQGQILLDGQDITYQAPNNRDMALVFQNYALFPHMTVFDNVAYGLQVRRLPRNVIREKVREVLAMMGLSGMEERRPNQLSGGQQQRVALARSLVTEPRILLFDEPLSNLDAKLRVQMRSEIHRLQRRLNITSIYVTHDQVEAMALSDQIVVMNKGRVEQRGSPKDIYRFPKTRFVADFIGRANFIETCIEEVADGQCQIELFEQKVTGIPMPESLQPGPAIVMIRPEALTLRRDDSLPQGRIEQAMYLGSEIEYIVSIMGYQLVVVDNDPGNEIFDEGQQVGVAYVREALHLLPPES